MICQSCEAWMTPVVDADHQIVRCSVCEHQQVHRFLPLFIVTGPSGAGKTTIVPALQQLLPTWDVFETDILWDSGGDWKMAHCNWLRIAQHIAQRPIGNPTILCGTILPDRIADCPSLPLFSAVHWLALLCEPATLAERLRRRPAWRGWDGTTIAEQLQFAAWFRAHGQDAFDPPLTIVDTTVISIEATAEMVRDWATGLLSPDIDKPAID
jgi:energy-coupling factor transporter ATP-binding protein EcfA2